MKKRKICKKDCCCNCINHHEDFWHCTTLWDVKEYVESKQEGKGVCICGAHKGWICAEPDLDGIGRWHSGWAEHGLCELHMRKKPVLKKTFQNVNRYGNVPHP